MRSMHKLALMIGFTAASLLAAPRAHADTAQSPHEAERVAQTSVQGVKVKVVSKAVQLVAKGIRVGNKHLGKIVSGLDAAAAGPFVKHSRKIADLLDGIASIPDIAEKAVGDKLFHALSDRHGAFKLSPGTANVIREAVMGAINALL